MNTELLKQLGWIGPDGRSWTWKDWWNFYHPAPEERRNRWEGRR